MSIKLNQKYFNKKRFRELLLLIIVVFLVIDGIIVIKIFKKYDLKIVEATYNEIEEQGNSTVNDGTSSETVKNSSSFGEITKESNTKGNSEKTPLLHSSSGIPLNNDAIQPSNIIEPLNEITSKPLNQYYSKKGEEIFGFGKMIPGIDGETFNTFKDKGNYIWSKDKNNVYLGIKNKSLTITIPGADPQSFEILNDNYFKDSLHVFYLDQTLNAHLNTFQIVSTLYAKDNTQVFFKANVIPNANPESFEVLQNGYSKDQNNIFFEGKFLADNIDFETLSAGYTKDTTHVFYQGKVVTNANPKSFEVLNSIRARDEKHVFVQGKIIPEINPKYLVVMNSQYAKAPNGVYHVNKNGSSYGVKKIEEADPYTFQPVFFLGMFDAQDKNNFYSNGKITKGF